MFVRESLFFWLVTMTGLCSALEKIADHFNYSTFVDVTHALHKDVKYMSERIAQMNADALFGVALAQANLIAALGSPNAKFISENERRRLVIIGQLCDNTRISARNKIRQRGNTLLNTLIDKVTLPEHWKAEIMWRKKSLPVPSPDPELTDSGAAALIFLGSPQESESDYCLTQLGTNDCEVTDICANMLVKNDDSRGYPLTHRLLFIIIATALECEQNSMTNFTTLIEIYCQKIFQDLIDLEAANFPGVSRDLIMEQIVLCGMGGYTEFTNEHYANMITSWQSPHGCYSGMRLQKRQVRRKKSSNTMDYGCDSHASGVAAATLSLIIRGYVENQLSPCHQMNDSN